MITPPLWNYLISLLQMQIMHKHQRPGQQRMLFYRVRVTLSTFPNNFCSNEHLDIACFLYARYPLTM